jgi:hypothetical protein
MMLAICCPYPSGGAMALMMMVLGRIGDPAFALKFRYC